VGDLQKSKVVQLKSDRASDPDLISLKSGRFEFEVRNSKILRWREVGKEWLTPDQARIPQDLLDGLQRGLEILEEQEAGS
jgi:hypothetical protein